MVEITCEDCMALISRYPDKYFDLAIVDPPYGDANATAKWEKRGRLPPTGRGAKYSYALASLGGVNTPNLESRKRSRFGSSFDKYKIERTGGPLAEECGKSVKHWDIAPDDDYFKELFRISEKAIIWGGNYFDLPPSRNFIIWRKLTISEGFTMAMAEYAWTNINGNAKVIECAPQDKNRFHPTQKPVYLYKKLLQWYAKPGYKILDTHLGSGSSAIACIDMGCDLTGCELDKDYYEGAMERIQEHQAQKELFAVGNAESELN